MLECQQAPSASWLAQSQLDLAEFLAAFGSDDERHEALALARTSRDAAFKMGMAVLRGRSHSLLGLLKTGEVA